MPSTKVEGIKAFRKKKKSEVDLEFCNAEDFDQVHLQELGAALSFYNTRSVTLQKIRVRFCLSTANVPVYIPGRIPLNMWNFIEGLADIRTVTSLELIREYDSDSVYVHPLTVLFRKIGNRLESLKMDNLSLVGTTQEILDFKAAIDGLSALKSFEFYNKFMIFVDETHNLNHDLDTTLAAALHGVDGLMPIISHLPSLEHFTIKSDMWEAQEGNTPIEPISHLLANQNILELELGNFSLSSQGYKIMPIVGRALQGNRTLQCLKLDILMLQHDHDVDYTNLHGIAETSLIWQPLGRALEVHPSLQELEMTSSGSYCPRFDPFLLLAADAISKNTSTSLEKLRIVSLFPYSESVEKAFLKLLISNYSLRQVAFLTNMNALENEYDTIFPNRESRCHRLQSATETREKIDFFLRLNRRGRKDIMARLEDASPSEWTDILAWTNNETSETYHYLRMNPSICNFGQCSAAPIGPSRRNRITPRHTLDSRNENSRYTGRVSNVISRPTLVRPIHITTAEHILTSKQRCDSMLVINFNESVGFDRDLIDTIKSLQVTWNLETVVLVMWSDVPDNSSAGSLLEALSELDGYRHLHITNWGTEIFLDDLSKLLESRVRHRLERFVYTGNTFNLNRNSKQRFVQALKGLETLKDFTFEDPTHPKIDGIDKVIAQLPCIKKVDMDNKTSLRHFFASSSITTLSVGWSSDSYEKLRLDQISLEHNQTISCLELTLTSGWNCDWNCDCLISIAKALESNTCLEELVITGSPLGKSHKGDHSLILLADALKRNDKTALRKLAVPFGSFSGADTARYRDNIVAEAFLKTLSTNCTLEDLEIYCLRSESCLDSGIRNSIALLMRLNKDGKRKFLMSNRFHLTKETWIHALVRFDEDTDVLFYYLRHNPWLCPGGSKQVNRNRIEAIEVIRGVDEFWG